LDYSPSEKRLLIDIADSKISVSRQAKLLGIARSTVYYRPVVNEGDLKLMNEIDEIYTQYPFYGYRRIRFELNRLGYAIGKDHTLTLMRKMGIQAIFPKKNLSKANQEHKKFPYLLRGVEITHVNHVWSTDITYIRMAQGFIYLVALIDWFSRFVLAFRLSTSMDSDFCVETLEESIEKYQKCDIHNSDQGSQFTCKEYISVLQENEIQISMDSKGRALDNIFVERLWRSVKYEEVYLKNYHDPVEAYKELKNYFQFYNYRRPHQSLDYKTPAEIYFTN
jgi:putative transposase